MNNNIPYTSKKTFKYNLSSNGTQWGGINSNFVYF